MRLSAVAGLLQMLGTAVCCQQCLRQMKQQLLAQLVTGWAVGLGLCDQG
jgi:hypothetical protein